MSKVLSLDLSTKSGWALFIDGKLDSYGLIRVKVEDFNVNSKPGPEKSPKYPWNIMDAANGMGQKILELTSEHIPDTIVIENTVKGSKNRHTQRILEWIHKSVLEKLRPLGKKIFYMDPSEWRKILELRLSKEDKKNNGLINKGLKKELGLSGKINKKHLSVRHVNQKFRLNLRIKDNDIADAINLNLAYHYLLRGING